MKLLQRVMIVLAATVAVPVATEAQVVGTFTWQTRPFCNLVTLTVVQLGAAYQLTGSDNLCGAGVAPITGTAVPGGGGSVALGFTVSLPTGRTAHLTATVNLANVSGTWTDADASTGPFAFTTTSTGGAPRPAPFAASSITVNQLAPTVYAGPGTAATVSRSDHDHDARYSPRTTTVRLSGYAMQPFNGGAVGSINGCARNLTTASFSDVVLPLPVGATINAVVVSALDVASSDSYSMSLERNTLGPVNVSSTTVGSASGGALAIAVVTHNLPIPAGLVVAANQTYHLRFQTAANTNGLCSVEYTYTAPPAN